MLLKVSFWPQEWDIWLFASSSLKQSLLGSIWGQRTLMEKCPKMLILAKNLSFFMFLWMFIIVTTSEMKNHLFFDDCKLPHLLKNVKMHRRAVLYFYNSLTFYSVSWCFQEQIQKFHVKMWKKSWTV